MELQQSSSNKAVDTGELSVSTVLLGLGRTVAVTLVHGTVERGFVRDSRY